MRLLKEVARRLGQAVDVLYSVLVITFITLTIIVTTLPVLVGYIWHTDRPHRNSRTWRD